MLAGQVDVAGEDRPPQRGRRRSSRRQARAHAAGHAEAGRVGDVEQNALQQLRGQVQEGHGRHHRAEWGEGMGEGARKAGRGGEGRG